MIYYTFLFLSSFIFCLTKTYFYDNKLSEYSDNSLSYFSSFVNKKSFTWQIKIFVSLNYQNIQTIGFCCPTSKILYFFKDLFFRLFSLFLFFKNAYTLTFFSNITVGFSEIPIYVRIFEILRWIFEKPPILSDFSKYCPRFSKFAYICANFEILRRFFKNKK